MTLLVYCSYSVLGQDREPDWVTDLQKFLSDNTLIRSFVLYRPGLALREQPDVQGCLFSQPHPFFIENAEMLRLTPQVLRDFPDADTQSLLNACDTSEPYNFRPYKDLFCLLRSHIVLVDLSTPSYGETFQDVFYAHLAKIPIVGISNRSSISPIMLNRIESLVSSSKIEAVVQQLVSYSLGYSQNLAKDAAHPAASPQETLDNGDPTTP